MSAIRVRIHEKTRAATLAGFDYYDLRSLLTLASIEAMRSLAEARGPGYAEGKPLKDPEAVHHYEEMVANAERGLDAIGDAFARSHGRDPKAPTPNLRDLPVSERRSLVEYAASNRRFFEELFKDMRRNP